MTCTFNFTKCNAVTYGLDLPTEYVFTVSSAGTAQDLTSVMVAAEIFDLTSFRTLATFTPVVNPLLGQVVLSAITWLRKPITTGASWRLTLDSHPVLRGAVAINGR